MPYRQSLCYGFICRHCSWKNGQKWLSAKWHILKAECFSSFSPDLLSTLSSAVLGSRSVFPARDWDSVGLCSYESHTRHWPDLSDTLFLSLSSSFCLCWGGSSEGGTWGSICTCFACTPGQRVSHRICVTVLVCAFKVVAAGRASPLST